MAGPTLIPLEKNRQVFALLSLHPSADSTPRLSKFRNILITIWMSFVLVFAFVCSVLFIYKNLRTDLASSLCAGIAAAGTGSLTYILIVEYFLRHDIKKIFEAFDDFYDLYKRKDSAGYMEEANNRGKWITEFFLKASLVSWTIGVVGGGCGRAVYQQIRYGYILPDSLFHPYKTILPWNQHTIKGWLLEIVVFNLNAIIAYCGVYTAFLTFFISICQYHGAFYNIFRDKISEMDAVVNRREEVIKLLHDSIDFHVSAKSLFVQTRQFFSLHVVVQLTCSVIMLTCSIFQLDATLLKIDLTFVAAIFSAAAAALNLLFYCYYGKQSTEYYAAYTDCLYESNWFVLPNDVQKLFILMLTYAQKPLYYHGHNIVNLNLETFSKLLKTVISYFLMFKTLTADY